MVFLWWALPALQAQSGGGYVIKKITIDGGGVTFHTGGSYRLGGTAGQPDARVVTGSGGYKLTGGFWFAPQTTVTSGACCIDPRGPAGAACSDVPAAAACVAYTCDVAALRPPGFLGCYGDADGNNVVEPGDRGFVAANIGQIDPPLLCLFDMDGNGFINPGDRGFVAANIGLCTPLPDWQNGSGLNHGAPDTRFAAATFLGAGTTCGTVSCP